VNEKCTSALITSSGWYNCDKPLTGQYFGIWHQLVDYLEVCEVMAFSSRYVTHYAVADSVPATAV